MIDTTQFQDKKVAYHTLGCKLNFAETSSIAHSLLQQGFRKVKSGEQADVFIINTCSVTDIADKKCRQAIHKFQKLHPNAFMIVTGCYAQLKPEEIAAMAGVDLVLGANEKFTITDYLDNLQKKEKAEFHTSALKDITTFSPSASQDDRTRYFLKVQDGCDYVCSYCTIPLARGKSRNGTIADTVAMAEKLATQGAKEIVLSGVNIGDFGKSTDESFLDLVKALDGVEGIERYRISSIEPNLLTNEIIEFVAHSKRFAPHFHIPLQSGSNEVLALMKRRYKRELFAQRVAKIKEIMPQAFIGVDVIVGVRGETSEYFEDACAFITGLDVSQLHVFTYSERPGTKALEIDFAVPQQEKKRRSEVLHLISDKKLQHFYRTKIGTEAIVLWESSVHDGKMYGFTENYIRVENSYNKALVNTLQKVKLGNFNLDNTALIAEQE
jgi:threonylcarbamoyladenosine tRNA methylthiotransferase MtaB